MPSTVTSYCHTEKPYSSSLRRKGSGSRVASVIRQGIPLSIKTHKAHQRFIQRQIRKLPKKQFAKVTKRRRQAIREEENYQAKQKVNASKQKARSKEQPHHSQYTSWGGISKHFTKNPHRKQSHLH